jgi:polar amino acid transport system permease protein
MNGLLIVWEHRDTFLAGLANTVSLTLLCVAISVPLSALGAVILIETKGAIGRTGRELVDLLRCVPFLLLAYVVYYCLPEAGLRLNSWWAGLLTLIIYNAAYLIEIFRSAALALPHEDIEAARAFGFTRALLYRRIIFPQIAVTSAPVIGNQIIVMIKDSALLMIITVQEISFVANFINANYFSPFAPFAVAMALYWGLCLIVEMAVRRMGAVGRLRYG